MKIPWMLSWSPGVVGCGEGGTAADGGVAEGPELHEGAGVGIGEGLLAEDLERLLRGGLGVGDDAVDGLLSVDVGGVLIAAAVAIDDGFAQERHHREDQRKEVDRAPALLR